MGYKTCSVFELKALIDDQEDTVSANCVEVSHIKALKML